MADRARVIAEARRTFGPRLTVVGDRLEANDETIERPATVLPRMFRALGQTRDPGVLPQIREAQSAGLRAIVAEGVDGIRKIAAGRDTEISPTELVGIEAIILLEGRPPLFIQHGDFIRTPADWEVLNEHRQGIKSSIERVGRVEVSGHPNYRWIGTGFLAANDAVVTNRHVAIEFAMQDGAGWVFQSGMSARLDFNEEYGALDPREFDIIEVIGVHQEHDLAVLRVAQRGGKALPDPVSVASIEPADIVGRTVYVVGYPAWDGRRNDPEHMLQIFESIFDVKRLQPGTITEWQDGASQFLHDCSTLGGNSGSPVFDLESHTVVGLHFGGRYLEGNNAVPLWTLVDDQLLKRAGIRFT